MPADPSKDYYFVLRDTPNTEAVLIEYGFLDSTGDDVEQLKNNWQNYAEAVVRAVAQYVGANYVGDQPQGYYTVKKGDTLYGIASKFGTTVDNIKSINNLTSNNLSIGQVLKVGSGESEAPSTSGNYYTVKSGDSLWSISKKFNTSVAELKELNNLSSNLLSIGQQLKISENIVTDNENVYTVQKGDTLYALAQKFGTTVTKLKALNNLTSNSLSIGQKLVIDGEDEEEIIHTVQKGDTLYSIARQYNTTVSSIQSLNNLNTSILSIGQKLKIK